MTGPRDRYDAGRRTAGDAHAANKRKEYMRAELQEYTAICTIERALVAPDRTTPGSFAHTILELTVAVGQ